MTKHPARTVRAQIYQHSITRLWMVILWDARNRCEILRDFDSFETVVGLLPYLWRRNDT